MSAFTVSKLTIDRCVSAMCREWQGGKAKTALGKRLMQLNRQAMDERYPGRHEESKSTDAEVEEYRYTLQARNPYLLLVALECLCYQCSEGEVPGTPLYAEIDRAANHWRGVILSAIPEYKAATQQAWQ
jgi:hypothetical protein